MTAQMLNIHDVVASNVAAIASGEILGADENANECLYQCPDTGKRCAVGVALSPDALSEILRGKQNSDTVKDLAACKVIEFASDIDEALIAMVQTLHDTCVNNRMAGRGSLSNAAGSSALQVLFSLPCETWADHLRDDLIPAVGRMFYNPEVSLWGGYVDFINVFSVVLRQLSQSAGRWHRVTDNHITSGV